MGGVAHTNIMCKINIMPLLRWHGNVARCILCDVAMSEGILGQLIFRVLVFVSLDIDIRPPELTGPVNTNP